MAKVNGGISGQGLRGRLGNIVFRQRPDGGTVAAAYAEPRNPRTPKQTQTKTAMARAGQRWRELTPEQAAQWEDYAASRTTIDPATGRRRVPQTYNVFQGLALKLQQMNPQVSLPVLPPSQAFSGDGIRVTISGGAGELTFTASGPNSANVATELLIQPLASIHRKPEAGKYRSAAFFPFWSGAFGFCIKCGRGDIRGGGSVCSGGDGAGGGIDSVGQGQRIVRTGAA